MKRTLYFAFLALTLGSLAFAQDGRGRNKNDQKPPEKKQEQRQSPPPQPRQEQKQPERNSPPPPQRREERQTPPPQPRQEQRQPERNSPPPPQRKEERQTPPAQPRQEQKQPERNSPPPPQRNDDRQSPQPKRDDTGRGQPRNEQTQPRQDRTPPPAKRDTPPQDRNNPGTPRRDDTGRGQVQPRNQPPQDNRGGGVRPGNPGVGDPVGRRGGTIDVTRNVDHNRPATRGERVTFSPPPVVVNSKTTTRAWREDRTVRTVPYRSGYYHYRDTWCDSDFFYPNYVFVYGDNCAPSPWYWYPHLPAYVAWNRCRPTVSVVFNFGYGSRYDYRPYHYERFDEDRLDCAADRLEDAFRRRDFGRMSYMVDRDDWVQIQVENADYYDLRGDDFSDMLRDLIEGTHTISYKITDVHAWRDGASITARHTYVDSWGRRESVEHSYGLRRTSRGYEIVSFRTDHL
ncbi:MAG: hypothetical protein JSS65_10245 [Armatimonadetes bacterium]|nr:hypothetical protein [Armatimonadota bacterium]